MRPRRSQNEIRAHLSRVLLLRKTWRAASTPAGSLGPAVVSSCGAPTRTSSSEAPGAALTPADDDGSLGPVLAVVVAVALLAAAVVAKQKQLGPCAPKKEKASDESIYS